MRAEGIVWQRILLTRLCWQARRPCDRCRPGWPCEAARYCWSLVDAASIALDLAVSRQHPTEGWRDRQAAIWDRRADEAVRRGIAWA